MLQTLQWLNHSQIFGCRKIVIFPSRCAKLLSYCIDYGDVGVVAAVGTNEDNEGYIFYLSK